ncbi:LAME_0G18162g1_1 [Lachancea meyersii CBS 8951]|uniref:LAME_0G18162g1_1 n=1 Tax=Lachancea meyersii CBS 8951 TaxID=1266667 RepID=A0A1G4KBZ9_9SACH|nr:LAME_0G18162g1_1 [Lachancea meyersii CBS 8951]
MNFSATVNVLRLFVNPKLCIPQTTIENFGQLPIPIGPSIKAVVLDKDNCFAYPHTNNVWSDYERKKTWTKLKETYPGASLLIVSNSAGSSDDAGGIQATNLEQTVGVPVLRHSVKKPGCRDEILDYFAKHNITSEPHEIAVVGDRLFTDILMANLMGSHGVWVRQGVKPPTGPLTFIERKLYKWMSPES